MRKVYLIKWATGFKIAYNTDKNPNLNYPFGFEIFNENYCFEYIKSNNAIFGGYLGC